MSIAVGYVPESPILWCTWTEPSKTLELKEDTMTTETKTSEPEFVMPPNTFIDSQDKVQAYFSSSERSYMDIVRDLTLSEIKFPHESYEGIIFKGSTFKKTPITAKRFDYCDFDSTSFMCSPITRSSFFYCDFDEAQLCGEIIKDTSFYMCDFRDANFDGCTLDYVTFKNCNLDGANLSNVTYLNYMNYIPFYNCNMNTDTPGDMRTFQIAGYPKAHFYKDKMRIGCLNHTIDAWIAKGEEIGKENDWPETVIESYMDFVKSCPKPEVVVVEPTLKRYLVCTTDLVSFNNEYFDSFEEAFDHWGNIVKYDKNSVTKNVELRDNDKILFTTGR